MRERARSRAAASVPARLVHHTCCLPCLRGRAHRTVHAFNLHACPSEDSTCFRTCTNGKHAWLHTCMRMFLLRSTTAIQTQCCRLHVCPCCAASFSCNHHYAAAQVHLGALDEQTIAYVLKQVLNALDYLHVEHRYVCGCGMGERAGTRRHAGQ